MVLFHSLLLMISICHLFEVYLVVTPQRLEFFELLYFSKKNISLRINMLENCLIHHQVDPSERHIMKMEDTIASEGAIATATGRCNRTADSASASEARAARRSN